MGKVADIINAPEWAQKTPLEKAQARRDLFALTLDEHPAIKSAFESSDDAGRQVLADQFKAKLEADYPEAFKTNGYKIEVRSDGARAVYGGFKVKATDVGGVVTDEWQGPKTSVYDIGTEQILKAAVDPSNREKFAALPEEQRHALAPFLYERYAPDKVDAELFGKPEDFIQRDDSTATKAVKFAVPALFRLAPPLVASVTKNPRIVAAAAGMGDAAAQVSERALGTRQSFSATEMGLNTLMAAIPAATVAKFANPAMNMAARAGVRAAEGAVQGAAFEGIRQAVDEGKLDASAIGTSAMFGAGLGSLVGAFEPKIAAMLAGKSADDAIATLKTAAEKAGPEERTALSAAQRRIEESLGIGAAAKDAGESAVVLSQEHPPVVNSAAESAQVLRAESYKSQRQLDMEAALNEADAANRSPQGASGLRAGMAADEAASRVANRTGTGAITPDGSLPILEAGQAQDPRIVTGPTDALGARMTPPVEINVGQSGEVRPAWESPATRSQSEIYSGPEITNKRTGEKSEAAGVTPPPPGAFTPSDSVAGQGAGTDAPAFSASGQAPATGAQATKPGKKFTVGNSPDGEMDLLSHIEDLGGIRGPNSISSPGGEYDGFREAFGSGPQRLLVRRDRGSAVDQLLPELAERGFKFDSPDAFYQAVVNAQKQRSKLAKELGIANYEAKFDAALLENTGRRTHLNTSDPVSVDTLNVGDQFNVRGEKFKVVGVDENTGAVTVKDGVKREIPAGTEVYQDKGEVKKAEISDEFLPAEAQAIKGQAGFIAPKLAASLAGGSAGFAAGAAQDPEGDTAQERAINRIKRGLMVGVVGAAGGYMLGRRFTNSAPRSAAPAGSVLAEVDKHLQPVDSPKLGSRIAAIPTQLRTALITRFAALDKLASEVARANPGAVLPEVPLSRKFEQIAGANGKAAQDVRDFEDSVVSQLAPTERHDFDRMLFLKRTGQRLQWNSWLAGEQVRITAIPEAQRTPDEVKRLAITQDKSVASWTLPGVDAGLAELKGRLGAQRFDEIDQLAAGEFQQAMDRALQLQVAAGRISPEAYKAIKAGNDFYAPFRVLSAIEGFDGAARAGGAAIDTRQQVVRAIEGISDENFRLESPTVAAAENLVRGRILAEKNLKMLELARLADADKTGALIRKLTPGQEARRGFETVNYFDQGEPLRLEVGPDVANAIKGLNPAETGLIAGLLQRSGAAFRFGATTANAAFQARNLLFADQPRLLLMSKYGIQADPRELWQLPTDFVHSLYSSALGNVAGKETALYRQFYESGAAGATFQDAINRIGGHVGDTALSRGTEGVAGLVDDVSAVTRVLEETTKLMGFKRGLRIEGIKNMSPGAAAKKLEEVVVEVRNFAGSPDFARHGTVARDANMFVAFFNARIQGAVSDIGRLGGTDGGKAARDAWLRLGATAGTAAAYFWYRNHSADNAGDYERVPDWEKNSYLMMPRYDANGAPLYSTNAQGEKVREYARLPKRESAKIIANMTEAALDFAHNKEPGAVAEFGVRLLEDTSPINIAGRSGTERLESAISNLTPALRLLYEVPGNRDAFRHRAVVPASRQGGADPTLQQYPGRTPEVYVNAATAAPTFLWDPLRSPLMLQHITEAMTGGLLRQFTPNQTPNGERDPSAAAMAANPVGRVFVGSLQVDDSKDTKLAQESLQQSRDRSIALDNEAMRELDGLAKLGPAEKEARVREIERTRPELIDAIADEADARAKNLTQPDRLARRMPVRDGTRVRYLAERFRRLPVDKREGFLRDQMAKGIATNEVIDQLAEVMAAGKN